MRRAPWPIGVAFGLSVALLVLLVGPLLLFNPWFVSALQERHGVAAEFGVDREAIDRVAGAMLGDLFLGGQFDAALDGEPLLDEFERSHMTDVSRLVRILCAIVAAALLVAVLAGRRLAGHPQRMAAILVVTGSAIGLTGLLVAGAFALAFEATFLAFHALFFPPGTYLFPPGSDLIRLFPIGFWFDASLVAGVTVILSAAVVGAIGLLGRRRPPAPMTAG